MKLLLDTNVLIDFIAQRQPFARDVRTLCVAKAFGDVQLWVSVQSYADAYYVLRKSASEPDVKRALLATLEFFTPCSTYAEDLQGALDSDWHDVEDYLIAHASKHINAHAMVTRDAEMIAKCPIRAMTSADAVRYLKEEQGSTYEDVEL